MSKEELKKKRLSSRALGEAGLRPDSVEVVYASYSSGVQTATVRAAPGLHLGRGRQHDAPGQRRPELGRDGEPVLRVERVFEGSAEGQGFSYGWAKGDPGGWVGGALPPGFHSGAHSNPLSPTMQPISHLFTHKKVHNGPKDPKTPVWTGDRRWEIGPPEGAETRTTDCKPCG